MRIKKSFTCIMVLLAVFVLNSTGFSASPKQQSEVEGQIISLAEGTRNIPSGLFGARIAGIYLVTRAPDLGPSRILTIFADGNLSSIQSIQFGGGVAGGGFSNQQGVWKRVGPREIQATVLDLSYELVTGNFLGPGVACYTLRFNGTFQTVTGSVNGKVYSPGVDPLNPGDANPIAEFSDAFEAQRVTAANSAAKTGDP